MATQFDDDTALRRDGDAWHGQVGDRWHIGAGANGGFMASYPLRAMLDIAPHPDPLSMTTHFLQRPVPGPATVRAEVTHAGKAHAFLRAELAQEHGPVLSALAVFGTLRDDDPDLHMVEAAPPFGTAPDHTPLLPTPDDMPFVARFHYRVPADQQEAVWGAAPAPARVFGWVRLTDRDLDNLAVPLFMDSFPPAVFASHGMGLAPTLELTVHWRSRPRTAWHQAEFVTRFLTGGYMEEDGLLWGEDRRLVAQSRQLARFTPMPQG